MTGSVKTLALSIAIGVFASACDTTHGFDDSRTIQATSGLEFQISEPEVLDTWTSVNLWTNGVPGDLSYGILEDGTVVVDAVIDAQIYTLTLENDRMVIEVNDGFDVRVTTVALVREDDVALLAEAFDAFPELPNRPLGYPFDGDVSHEVALTTLSVLAESQPELQVPLDVIIAATLSLESLTPEDAQDGKSEPDSAQAQQTPLARSSDGGISQENGDGHATDLECEGEELIVKPFEIGPTVSLNAGPVSVSMTAVSLDGSSMCHPRFSPAVADIGSFNSKYDPDGGNAAGCSRKYEAAYTASGSKTVTAKNGPCCFADGATDTAEVGSFKAEVFGKGFNLAGGVSSASSDMTSVAEASISGTATICIDYDWINEAMLMSSATASATCI